LAVWTGSDMSEELIRDLQDNFHVAHTDDGTLVAIGKIDLVRGSIDAIFVDPCFARRGWGRRMLRHLEQLARSAGLAELHLDSTLNAAPFYRAHGYRGDEVSTYRSPRGVTLACVPMTKSLLAPEPTRSEPAQRS